MNVEGQPGPPARRLTEAAQDAISEVLQAGDMAIDATMGNGHDTVFLARQVGREGRVLAVDIQPAAIASTQRRLQQEGLRERVRLELAGHQDLQALVAQSWRGRIGAAMFNLGYLPGSNKRIVTQANHTGQALAQLPGLMRPGARVSVLVYRGHAGGAKEFSLLEELLQSDPAWRLVLRSDQNQATEEHHPVLFVLEQGDG